MRNQFSPYNMNKTTRTAILAPGQTSTTSTLFQSMMMSAPSNPSVQGMTADTLPSISSNTLTDNVYGANTGPHCDYFDLPADALEPNPIRENHSRESSLGATLLEKVLDHVLVVMSEPTDSLSINNRKKQARPQPITPAPMPKRRRISSTDAQPRFRGYQETQWIQQFNELVEFKEQQGHCLVPHTYPENQVLSRWVKRQRYQYKLKIGGKESTMTDVRIKNLEDIGFVWDSHAAAWEKRFRELQQYHSEHGNCNVPSNYPENQELATWIKCQRRQYKLYWDKNKSSSMTFDRMNVLNKLGFIWKVREDLPLVSRKAVMGNRTNM